MPALASVACVSMCECMARYVYCVAIIRYGNEGETCQVFPCEVCLLHTFFWWAVYTNTLACMYIKPACVTSCSCVLEVKWSYLENTHSDKGWWQWPWHEGGEYMYSPLSSCSDIDLYCWPWSANAFKFLSRLRLFHRKKAQNNVWEWVYVDWALGVKVAAQVQGC